MLSILKELCMHIYIVVGVTFLFPCMCAYHVKILYITMHDKAQIGHCKLIIWSLGKQRKKLDGNSKYFQFLINKILNKKNIKDLTLTAKFHELISIVCDFHIKIQNSKMKKQIQFDQYISLQWPYR